MKTIVKTDPEHKEPVKLPHEAVTALGAQLDQELMEALWSEQTLRLLLDDFSSLVVDSSLTKEIQQAKRVTDQLIANLISVFTVLGEQPAEQTCEALKVHFEEGKQSVMAMPEGFGRDVAIVTVLQKGLHYNVAVFQTLLLLSEQLGLAGAAATFRPTLEDKKASRDKLQELAVQLIASQEGE